MELFLMVFYLLQSVIPNVAESAVTVVTTLYRVDTVEIDDMEMEASDPVFGNDKLHFTIAASGSLVRLLGLVESKGRF